MLVARYHIRYKVCRLNIAICWYHESWRIKDNQGFCGVKRMPWTCRIWTPAELHVLPVQQKPREENLSGWIGENSICLSCERGSSWMFTGTGNRKECSPPAITLREATIFDIWHLCLLHGKHWLIYYAFIRIRFTIHPNHFVSLQSEHCRYFVIFNWISELQQHFLCQSIQSSFFGVRKATMLRRISMGSQSLPDLIAVVSREMQT